MKKTKTNARTKKVREPGEIPSFFKGICRALSFLIGLALVLAALAVGTVYYFNAPPSSPVELQSDTLRVEDDGKVFIEVRNGESASSVGVRLEKAGIIKSRYFWNLLSRLDKDYIKTGMYRFNFPASQMEIHSILVSGQQIMLRVTIPEGVTLKKTASILADAGICERDAFLDAAADPASLAEYRIPGASMEGYLYPDTYLFPASYPAAQVVRTMADTFFKRLENTGADFLALTPKELNDKVILASIIEREYRVDDEAPIMAGVFYNRLNIGMALQSCATVEYIITEIQGRPHPTALYDRDTAIQNPYNTYNRRGLPPGPISAPGLVALNAVFHPAASDYLYFRLVNPAEGRHYFSKSFDEHIQAGVLYVKGGSF
ncbi:hypothetical protein FACS189473_0380 [Spirochaetia bacterium]|nr:hypothetical protein FACS189473_0380 [Spirochaetia bacterium]